MEGILISLMTALITGFIAVLVIYYRYEAPLSGLKRLTRLLANDQKPRTFYVNGPVWAYRMSQELEKIASRVSLLTRQQQEEDFNLNALLGSMVEGVMVVDRHHVIRLVNKELLNLFGLKNSPLQRTVLESLRESGVELLLRETITTGKAQRRELFLESSGPGNTPRCFEVSAVPIREKEGEIDGAVTVFHDITRIKQLEAVRQEFVANVSHELRTPLAIFRGYLETLIDHPELTQAESNRILEAMLRHSNRLNALVEDLLALTRLDGRNVELQFSTIRLEAFLNQLVTDWQKRFKSPQAEVTFELAKGLPALEVDPLRFEQVILNLLDNAVAYSNPPRKIHFQARMRDDKFMEIRLQDNGIGIPPGDLPHVFERFYRVDKGRSRSSGGTGLGLSIVKHIVQIHEGKVLVESEVGKGTIIILQMPRSQEVV